MKENDSMHIHKIYTHACAHVSKFTIEKQALNFSFKWIFKRLYYYFSIEKYDIESIYVY